MTATMTAITSSTAAPMPIGIQLSRGGSSRGGGGGADPRSRSSNGSMAGSGLEVARLLDSETPADGVFFRHAQTHRACRPAHRRARGRRRRRRRRPGRPPRGGPPTQARNVIVITLDGMRWQEVFGGAERALMGKDEKAIVESSSYKRFWRDGAVEERRAALMPFLWSVVARDGTGVRRPGARERSRTSPTGCGSRIRGTRRCSPAWPTRASTATRRCPIRT